MYLSRGVDRLHTCFGRLQPARSGTRCSRGQTPVDYLVGISLLLVTILGTFALVPTIFDPFEPAVSPDKQSISDRLAEDLVTNHTYTGEERTLNRAELEASLDNDLPALRADAGIRKSERVNVTIQNGTGTQLYTAGDPFVDGAGGDATSVRTFATRDKACADGCRLIVRVWSR
jgi:hypothetical protein